MKNMTKIKNVYKTIVKTFLKTEDVFTYWEFAKAMQDFIELFPDIDFKKISEEIRKELFEEDIFINSNRRKCSVDNQKKEEITHEDFTEKYCNNECKMKKCEGIGTTWSVCCPYQSQVNFIRN